MTRTGWCNQAIYTHFGRALIILIIKQTKQVDCGYACMQMTSETKLYGPAGNICNYKVI